MAVLDKAPSPEQQLIIDMYLEANPTPETSAEIVADIAEQLNKPKNSVRMILSNAKVYVKKASAVPSGSKATAEGDKAPRRGKQEAINELTALIKKLGQDPDEDILSKMTGKAATYFVEVFGTLTK